MEAICHLKEDNVEAFDRLYYQYHRAIFANISKLIIDRDAAEDIMQEVFMALWENRKKIDPAQDVAGWLFVVSYNKSIAFLKKKVNEKIIFSEKIAEAIEKVEIDNCDISELQLNLLNDAINSLSPRKKKVFELCRLQGKSYSEAATILGLSTETIKDYLKESLKYIREFIFSKYSGSTFLSIICLLTYLQG